MRGNETVLNHPIRCYEDTRDRNGWDIWTVVYMDQPEHDGLLACVGLSGHGTAMIGAHLGKRVPFSELPDNLQAVVRRDLKEGD